MWDVWLLDTNKFNTYAWYEQQLSERMIKAIHEMANSIPEENATVGDVVSSFDDDGNFIDRTSQLDLQTRKSNIKWIMPDESTEWLYRHLTDVTVKANEEYFNFDLVHIEPLQYTIYNEGGFYTKHIDTMWRDAGKYPRKLSFTIQLSDPSEYEGGDLLLYTEKEPFIAKKDKGAITFFPSFVMHEITPVTKGTRRSLVGWIRGPKWK